LAWANSETLACALSLCLDINGVNPYVIAAICNYSPAGNVVDEPVYLDGESQSNCEAWNVDYPGREFY
jgi:hypothetical protein